MITIKPNELEAVALSSSTEQTRYYLVGVCFEPYDKNTCGMVATDGHRFHAINADLKAAVPANSFILSSDDVKKVLSMVKAEQKAVGRYSKNDIMISIKLIKDDLQISVIWINKNLETVKTAGSFTTKPVDGSFPDWRRTVPSELAPETHSDLAFNCSYMADFGKAAKILGDRRQLVKIISSGRTSPMLVNLPFYPSFMGVLMPMRA